MYAIAFCVFTFCVFGLWHIRFTFLRFAFCVYGIYVLRFYVLRLYYVLRFCRFTFCVFTTRQRLPFLFCACTFCVFCQKCVFYRCNAFCLVLLHLKSYAHFINKLCTPKSPLRFERRARPAPFICNSSNYKRITYGRLFAHFRTCSVVPLRHLNEPALHSVASAKTRKCYALANKNTYCKKMQLYYKM